MPRVEVEILVDAPAERVYEVVADMEHFADFMADVESVTTVERGQGYTVTAWSVKARGARLRWTERDEFFPNRVVYRQIKGDLRRFEGEWQLDPVGPDRTKVTLTTDFELGLPMLAALFNPIAAHILRDNARSMLASVGRAVAADGPPA